jgi:hypothetical protein
MTFCPVLFQGLRWFISKLWFRCGLLAISRSALICLNPSLNPKLSFLEARPLARIRFISSASTLRYGGQPLKPSLCKWLGHTLQDRRLRSHDPGGLVCVVYSLKVEIKDGVPSTWSFRCDRVDNLPLKA